MWKCVFVLLVCFVLQVVIFNAFMGFGVIFCIYEHILKIFFTFFERCPDVWTIFVRTAFYDFLWFGGICCHHHHHHHPIPIPIPSVSQSSLPGEKNIESNVFKWFFSFFVIFCSTHPIPIPGVSKSSLPGETNIQQNVFGEMLVFCFPPSLASVGGKRYEKRLFIVVCFGFYEKVEFVIKLFKAPIFSMF